MQLPHVATLLNSAPEAVVIKGFTCLLAVLL